MYCDLDRSMNESLFRARKQYGRAGRLLIGTVSFVLMTKPWNMNCINSFFVHLT